MPLTKDVEPISGVTEAIERLLENGTMPRHPKGKQYPKPYEINDGLCEDFAYDVVETVDDPNVRIDTPEAHGNEPLGEFGGHVWITDGDYYYDAEKPEGVEDWKALPFFLR